MAKDKTASARRADETIAGLLRGGATPLSPFWTSQTLPIWLLQATSRPAGLRVSAKRSPQAEVRANCSDGSRAKLSFLTSKYHCPPHAMRDDDYESLEFQSAS
jgi:hypothetical protein